MNTKIPIVFLFLFLLPASIGASGFSEEIYTSFKAGPAYEIEDEICFLAAYRLYLAPRGLRRFPDGGQSRTVFQSTYILTLKEGLPGYGRNFPAFPLQTIRLFPKAGSYWDRSGPFMRSSI